jgi:hypothetical protein
LETWRVFGVQAQNVIQMKQVAALLARNEQEYYKRSRGYPALDLEREKNLQ